MLGCQLVEDACTWREHSYNEIEGLGIGSVVGISTECLASVVGASINKKLFVSMHFIDS
jgi:lipid-binding SYLF domain-containing protein